MTPCAFASGQKRPDAALRLGWEEPVPAASAADPTGGRRFFLHILNFNRNFPLFLYIGITASISRRLKPPVLD